MALEAMASGTPVVVAADAGALERWPARLIQVGGPQRLGVGVGDRGGARDAGADRSWASSERLSTVGLGSTSGARGAGGSVSPLAQPGQPRALPPWRGLRVLAVRRRPGPGGSLRAWAPSATGWSARGPRAARSRRTRTRTRPGGRCARHDQADRSHRRPSSTSRARRGGRGVVTPWRATTTLASTAGLFSRICASATGSNGAASITASWCRPRAGSAASRRARAPPAARPGWAADAGRQYLEIGQLPYRALEQVVGLAAQQRVGHAALVGHGERARQAGVAQIELDQDHRPAAERDRLGNPIATLVLPSPRTALVTITVTGRVTRAKVHCGPQDPERLQVAVGPPAPGAGTPSADHGQARSLYSRSKLATSAIRGSIDSTTIAATRPSASPISPARASTCEPKARWDGRHLALAITRESPLASTRRG